MSWEADKSNKRVCNIKSYSEAFKVALEILEIHKRKKQRKVTDCRKVQLKMGIWGLIEI
jgi:hypothetical protein